LPAAIDELLERLVVADDRGVQQAGRDQLGAGQGRGVEDDVVRPARAPHS
jgi:hypothetical protein